jgi:DcuC family C4-dicarboxylate transporter
MPDPTLWFALPVVAAAVAATLRGADVRLALFAAALGLGLLAGDPAAVVREFLATFSNEKFVVPICTSMGFAYVLKHTGCDRHLVRALVGPIRRARLLLVPGVVGVGFLVNVPVVSQTSTVVCLGTVAIPLMRTAGFSAASTGAALLLGASVGGELLNPSAPELLAVKERTGRDTRAMLPTIAPLAVTMLAVSAAVLWATEWWRGRAAAAPAGLEDSTRPTEDQDDEPINPVKALVPLVPLAILFLSGPPLNLFDLPQKWVVEPPADGKLDPRFSTRLTGLAMLVGVAAAAAAAPGRAAGCMRAFFDGAGYGFTHVISLIVVANSFGRGIERVGLARPLGDLIAAAPGLLHPLAAAVPCLFAFVCGSGIASSQSLYGFFYDATVPLGQDPVAVGGLVSVGSAAGRTMSPVAAVVLMTATLTGATPGQLVRRVAPPLAVGLAAVVGLRLAGVV